ncbi:hypothetical protein BH09BAC1_BH09BAC1_07420 [soil metagenome]
MGCGCNNCGGGHHDAHAPVPQGTQLEMPVLIRPANFGKPVLVRDTPLQRPVYLSTLKIRY